MWNAAPLSFPLPGRTKHLGKATRKYYRTLFLGVAAMAALVWSAVDQFGIPWEEMLKLLLVTVAVIALVILVAAICVGLWVGLRKLLGKEQEP